MEDSSVGGAQPVEDERAEEEVRKVAVDEKTHGDDRQTVTQHETQNLTTAGAEGHAEADLAGAASNDVAQSAVKADESQDQGEYGQ